jgi:iron complex transport system substrate-binding protein
MRRAITVLLWAMVISGCSTSPQPSHRGGNSPTWKSPQRIISLAPSVTEMLFAVGAGPKVVGRDDYSNFPPEAAGLPRVGASSPNYEAIVGLRPDLVVGVGDLQGAALRRCKALHLGVLALDTTSYDKTIEAIRILGEAAGTPDRTGEVVRRLTDARDNAARLAPARRLTVLFVAEAEPSLYVAGKGTFLDELIGMAGGGNAAPIDGFGVLSRETLAAHPPDLVVTSERDLPAARSRLGPHCKIVASRGDILVRPGPRLGEGLAWLSGQIRKAAPAE